MASPLLWNQTGLTWTRTLRWNGRNIPTTTRMSKIVLNLDRLTDGDVADLLRAKALTLTEHPTDFPTPKPTPAELTTAAGAIDGAITTAETKAQEAKAATSAKDTIVEAGREALRDLARYAEDKKLPAETVELLFNLKRPPTPTTSIDRVLGLAATFGDKAGEIDLTWEPVEKARNYQVEWRLAGTSGAWTLGKLPSASSLTLKDLPSGQRVEIRVRALGPKELEGEWSDSAEHLVP